MKNLRPKPAHIFVCATFLFIWIFYALMINSRIYLFIIIGTIFCRMNALAKSLKKFRLLKFALLSIFYLPYLKIAHISLTKIFAIPQSKIYVLRVDYEQ